MKKTEAVALSLTGLLVLGATAYMCLSCPSIPLHFRAFQGPRAGPGDCFPELSAAEGSGSPRTISYELDEAVDVPFDLSGTWAQQQVTATLANAPFIGDVHTVMTNILRMDVVQNGNLVDMTAQVCAIIGDSSSSAAHTIIPQAFVEAIGISPRKAVLEPVGGAFRFHQQRYTRVLGVNLDNPETDELPDDEDDPRVFDHDGDGHPGVTVTIEGIVDGDIYLTQRHWKELCGDVLSPNHVEGYINWDTQQETIGASTFMLSRSPTTVVDPNWEANRFEMWRIDPTMTCEEILQNRESIFPPDQPDSADP